MKTGLHLKHKLRLLNAYLNLLKFKLKKKLFSFEIANQFIQRVDKLSLQMILKANGAQIGRNCDIETGLSFHNCLNYNNLNIGENCHIGKNCFFDLRDKVKICDNIVIAMQCTFITHIDMTKSSLNKLFPSERKGIIINSNAYIGAGSTVLMGVTIGESCFIGSNTLVNKNTEPNSMYFGIPAKLIKNLNVK
jgi:acetyltransferase-like isoleucine patch superfamily enzyme